MDDHERVAMDAAMEGESAVVKSIGRKVKVSSMELIVLCNFAHAGCLFLCSELDGEVGEQAGAELLDFLNAVRKQFSGGGKVNGLNKLMTSCIAMLGQERFSKYIVPKQE